MLFLAEMMARSGITAGKSALTVTEKKKSNWRTPNCVGEALVNGFDLSIIDFEISESGINISKSL